MYLINPLYIHGWGFSSKVFKGFEGIKPDLPGHGSSILPYRGIETIPEQLAPLIKGKSDIVGWSMGASIAIIFVLKFPDKVNRLFLIGGTPCFRRAWKESNIRAFRIMIRKGGISAFRRLAGLESFEDNVDMAILFKMLDDYINLDLTHELEAVRCETFIVHGEGDRVVPISEAVKLKDGISGSRLVILKGGHLPVKNERDLIQAVFQIR